MTIRHHPSDALLLEYAAGTLGPAMSLAVASHLTFCPHCRATGSLLDAVGGAFFREGTQIAPADDALSRIMARVGAEKPASTVPAAPVGTVLPAPLRTALGGDLDRVAWKRLGRGAYHCVLPLRDPDATARLLRIPAGRPVPTHTHRGIELTLVLCGAFADATGTFARGDMQEADETLTHQPHAAAGDDCVCLAVTQAPLRFSGWAARLVQPFLGI